MQHKLTEASSQRVLRHADEGTVSLMNAYLIVMAELQRKTLKNRSFKVAVSL